MNEPSGFASIEAICEQAREQFRSCAASKADEIDKVFVLFLDVFRGIGTLYNAKQLGGSSQEAAIAVIVQAVETVLAMYFMAEDGFWTNSLALKRNYSELMLVAMAIGYDPQCFIDWKHERDNFASFEKIYRRVEESKNVPPEEKGVLPLLKSYWAESSQHFSHGVLRSSIRTLVRDGGVQFEPKVVTCDFQEGRMCAIRNMLLNLVSVLLGITNFGPRAYERREEFPEGARIIARANDCFQNDTWKNERTN
jgi:hypothetical protein